MTGSIDPRREVGSLRHAAMAGVKWTSVSAAAVIATGILQPLILVRLLDPRDFGLVASVFVIVGFTRAFIDLGITGAIKVRKEIPRDVLSSLFWTNMLVGVALGALVFFSAPLIVDFYQEPELLGLTHWAALAFVLAPLGTIHRSRLERDLRFDLIAKAEVAAAAAGLAVAVTAAALGAGAVALVWGWLTSLALAIAIVSGAGLRTWRPRLHFARGDLSGFIGFGAYQMGERSINYLGANMDYVLIGRFLGAEALGIYAIAYQLVVRPLAQLNPVLLRVAVPVFARKQDDDAALRRGFLEVSRLIAFISMPLIAGLALVAGLFVPVVLGEEWEPSIVLIQVLAGVGLLKTLNNPMGAVFLAKNRPDLGFKLNLVSVVVFTWLLLLVAREGTEAVAWAYLGFTITLTVVVMPWILRRTIGLRSREYVRAFVRPAWMTLAMTFVAGSAYLALELAAAAPALMLLVVSVIGASLYGVLLLTLERAYVREILLLFRGRANLAGSGRLGSGPTLGETVV